MKKLIYILALVAFAGCMRSPEEPDGNAIVYEPATSPENVIINFKYSITDKNTARYMDCFIQDNVNVPYEYYASAEARAQYPGLFDNWKREDELRYFNSFVTAVPAEQKPGLEWLNFKFDHYPPDSSVFFADYELTAPMVEKTQKYKGTLYITLSPLQNGEWRISRWRDSRAAGDSSSTWSLLKALFYN